ncbi:hypothetical protein KIL84_016881 [Mauremys mutica]|uniref:Uncharacterized protein n=1 Tax=Mauremys mutica TaxID=74926 RepID=A0A9D3X5A9_9SAUR|nr:hypothetical protein KIL84_016881 [Mauremys mutica]
MPLGEGNTAPFLCAEVCQLLQTGGMLSVKGSGSIRCELMRQEGGEECEECRCLCRTPFSRLASPGRPECIKAARRPASEPENKSPARETGPWRDQALGQTQLHTAAPRLTLPPPAGRTSRGAFAPSIAESRCRAWPHDRDPAASPWRCLSRSSAGRCPARTAAGSASAGRGRPPRARLG